MNQAPVTTLWNSAECAHFLSVSERTVRKMRQDGSGPPYVQMGRSVRYAPTAVMRWVQQSTIQTADQKPASS